MKNRCVIVLILIICIFPLSSCLDKVPPPVYNSDGSVSWNGWTLTRYIQPYNYPTYDTYSWISAQPNVLDTKQSTLFLSLTAINSNSYEFGTNEQIHVLFEGHWYVLPFELCTADKPLILPARERKIRKEQPVEYEINLSGIGALPAGAYRLAEELKNTSNGTTEPRYARFWVKSRYAQSPPEAATEGKARREDIVLSVDSSYPAQRAITAADDMFTVVAENLSGKTYKPVFVDEEDNGIVLERLTDGEWTQVQYSTANTHSYHRGWSNSRMEVFIFDVLPEGVELPTGKLIEGHYRVRLPMTTDDGGLIEPSYEFDVLSPGDAPPPQWNMEELRVSEYAGREQSDGVKMEPVNPVVSGDNIVFETKVTVTRLLTYGSDYSLETEIDGTWYSLPFKDATAFGLVAYSMPVDGKVRDFSFDITSSFGNIPPGKYRVIRDFKNDETGQEEFAAAEFTVSG